MRQRVAGAVLVLLGSASGVVLTAQTRGGTVRPEAPAVRALIDQGVVRSPTFRALMSQLDSGGLVVYVRFAPCTGRAPACLVWASPDAATRRVLIKIDRFSGSEEDLTALLAHELQHAFEVASTPEIRDARSFAQWFEAHGRRGSNGFETNEAAAMTRTVAAELRYSAVRTAAR